MTKPLGFLFFKELLENMGYKVFYCEYKNISETFIEFQDEEGYFYSMTPSAILATVRGNHNFSRFHTSNKFTIENIKIHIQRNFGNKIEYFSGEYLGARERNLLFKCLNDGSVFKCSWNEVYMGERISCPDCSVKRRTISRRLSIDSVKTALLNLGIEMINEEDYENVEKKIWVRCLECNHSWERKIHSLKTDYGCPRCRNSKGEKEVERVLNILKIDYQTQKKFPNCKNIFELPFDFYLNRLNSCIEYNGVQHYKIVDFSYSNKFSENNMEIAKKQFDERLKRDKIKIKFCEDNKIPLLIIPYWEMENISEIISNFINQLGGFNYENV